MWQFTVIKLNALCCKSGTIVIKDNHNNFPYNLTYNLSKQKRQPLLS